MTTYRTIQVSGTEVFYREAGNRLTGRVVSCSYHGDAFAVQVDVACVGRVAVVTPTWRGATPRDGEEIALSWDADASIAVVED